MLFELIITGAVGLLCVLFGLAIWKKQKISLIHSYHYKKVKEENKKAYTACIGKGLIIIGAGCVFTGIFDYIMDSAGGWIDFGIAFFCGLSTIMNAQKKYNGGLF